MNPFTYNSAEQQQRPLVTWLLRICLIAGCLFTGMHNYALYLRGLSDAVSFGRRQSVAFAIAFLLEAAFYFSVECRGRVFVTIEQRWASGWGAVALFGVIALNTFTDHAMNVGAVTSGDWLSLWATYGAAAMVVGVVGYIGYLKANSPEAQLAAAAATAEAARVSAKVRAQMEILTDPQVIASDKAQARAWALGNAPQAARLPAPVAIVAEPQDADRRGNSKASSRPNA